MYQFLICLNCITPGASKLDMEKMYFRTKALLDEQLEQKEHLEEAMDTWRQPWLFEANFGTDTDESILILLDNSHNVLLVSQTSTDVHMILYTV